MLRKHILFPVLFCCFMNNKGMGQESPLADSLQRNLRGLRAEKLNAGKQMSYLFDTSIVKTLGRLAGEYWNHDPDKALAYATEMLELAKKIGYKRGIGNAYNNLGIIYWYKGDHVRELEYLNEALKMRIEAGDKEQIASSYGNIGITYRMMGNYPEALNCQFKALKIFEEIGEQSGIAFSLNNIGTLHSVQKNYSEALKSYLAAAAIEEKSGNHDDLGNCYTNIGNNYMRQGNNSDALKYYLLGLKEKETAADKFGISVCYNNISEVYCNQNNFIEALKYVIAAVNLKREIGDREGLVHSYAGTGQIHFKQKKLAAAARYFDSALVLAKQVGGPDLLERCYFYLAGLDSALGKFPQAFKHYKLYVFYRDSVLNNENVRKTTEQKMQYEFDKKETIAQAAQDKKNKIAEAALLAHRNERNMYMVIGIFLLVVVAGLWSRMRLLRRTRKLMDEKNEQIRKEKEEAEQQRMRAEMMDMRHKIAKDLHDDIGSSLSSIAIYSEVAQKITSDKMPEASKILVNVGGIAQEAMENMSDIVWTINPVNDKLDDILQRLNILSGQLREATGINVHFDVPDDIREVRLNMHQRKNVYLIFKEAINNVTKYSGARNCYVLIKKKDDQVMISIRDDGKGFTNTGDSLGGNGLVNMNNRAVEMDGKLEIVSGFNLGTEIKFNFRYDAEHTKDTSFAK
jgi:two-component system, NarL family, sensor histidine kinase UhpB